MPGESSGSLGSSVRCAGSRRMRPNLAPVTDAPEASYLTWVQSLVFELPLDATHQRSVSGPH